MAVTRADLLVYIGSESDGGDQDALLDRLLASAVAIVGAYADDSTPEAVQDQAVTQVAALLWYNRGGVGTDGRIRQVHVLRDSGARALLKPYRPPVIGGTP